MKKVRIISGIKKEYPVQEAYKTLRTNLLFCGEKYRTVLFTSCYENEGKTTVTLELARSLVQAGKRVLMIDADMRKSVLCKKYIEDFPETPGLSEYLSGQAALSDIVLQSEEEENFFLIPCGMFPPNPVELLGTARFQGLLESSKETFDCILIDTPPLGLVIDSAVAAKACDGAVLVLRPGLSARMVNSVKEQLEKSGCPLLGCVLNGVPVKRDLFYRHYYKHYYRGYYKHNYDAGKNGKIRSTK